MESLRIVHFRDTQWTPTGQPDWLSWKTCLRQIFIGFESVPSSLRAAQAEIFEGQEAYAFFLQVVCGLHSPLLGETEVMGQFKELVESLDYIQNVTLRSQMSQFFKSILTDSKRVRETCLKHLGSRTYGSLLRRYLKNKRGVSLVGAGKLAEDILPWLKNDGPVDVYCRRPAVAAGLQNRYDFAEVHLMDSKKELHETLIIAASMTSADIKKFAESRVLNLKLVIDLRDISSSDSTNIGNIPTLTLSHFFDEIKKTEVENADRVLQARTLIEELAVKAFQVSEIRPFGWEDLCG